MGNQQGQKPPPGFGYRILSIEKDSQGYKADLQIFTDFIIDAQPVNNNNQSLPMIQLIGSKQAMEFKIYNVIDGKERNVSFGCENEQLGMAVRLESYEQLLQLRVTNIIKNSPAELQGLEKQTDFIIGLLELKCTTLDEFTNIIQNISHQQKSLNICVYSISRQPSIRMIKIEPRFDWGGPGCIGCEFATGALHSFKSPHLTVLQEKTQDDISINDLSSRKNGDCNSDVTFEQNQISFNRGQNTIDECTYQQQQSEEEDTLYDTKDLESITADDLKYGQVYNFKGILRYASRENQINQQINLSTSRSNQWLTDDHDSSAQHSPNCSQSSLANQEDLFANLASFEICPDKSSQQLLVDIPKNDEQDLRGFRSPKRETNYLLDIDLLFNKSLQIEYKPFYLYQ